MVKDLFSVAGSSVISLAVLFLLTRLMGQKQVSQLNMFDYIIGISIGSIAAEMASEIENPERPLAAMVIYGLAAVGISVATQLSVKARRKLNGAPVILLRGNIIYREKLKKARLDINDLLMAARGQGYFDISEVSLALLEHNGTVSFLPREDSRPLTPRDMDQTPEQTLLGYAVISDGKISDRDLEKSGRDRKWLSTELKKQGIGSASDVFLGYFDGKNTLTVFRGSE